MHMNTPDDIFLQKDTAKRVRLNSSKDAVNCRPESTDENFGFRPFPKRGGIVTNELIDRLRNEAGV